MLELFKIPAILSVVLLYGPTQVAAQNTVLITSTALPGGGMGIDNVAVGPNNIYPSASNANFNVFVGAGAGVATTTGRDNLFTGYQAGLYNTTGNSNLFEGSAAGTFNTTGSRNSFIGYHAGYYNTTGSNNSFTGYDAGFSNSTGGNNSFAGYRTGYANTTGGNNSFTGSFAGYQNITGSNNAFMGYEAGYSNTGGNNNVFTGFRAGYLNVSGAFNTFMGSFTNPTGPNQANLQTATALGYNAKVAVDFGLVLGDTANVKVGIGTAYPNQKLTLRGNMNFVAYDNSLRLKNEPFLHFNEHESLALGLGSELPSGTEKTIVLGSKETTVQIPGILNSHLPHAGQFLTVDEQGNLRLSQPRVQVASVAEWSDKVFEPGYALRPLGEVEEFVKKNRHLPGVPSAKQMMEEGMESAAFNAKLLEKIEELTLYVVALEKKNELLEKQVSGVDELRTMVLAMKKSLAKSEK